MLLFLMTGILSRAVTPIGFDYSLFDVRHAYSVRNINGLFEKINFVEGRCWNVSIHKIVTRHSYLCFGMGFMTMDYQKEIEGIFPETGQYGTIIARGKTGYWSFPVSLMCMNAGRAEFSRGIIITYLPSFEGQNSFSVNTYGGALQSAYRAQYTNEEQAFTHALLFTLTNQLNFYRGYLRLCIDPYVGIGSGLFKYEGAAIDNLRFGISFKVITRLPHISIERECSHHNDEKKKLLEQKQKEIEQQLKNKPKQ
ncbi:MAG TPA: hypothetical protein VI112_10290 [Bacteroidia bacterium]